MTIHGLKTNQKKKFNTFILFRTPKLLSCLLCCILFYEFLFCNFAIAQFVLISAWSTVIKYQNPR